MSIALVSALLVIGGALIGCTDTAKRAAAASLTPAAAVEPSLSPSERHYIGAAWRATVAHDHACYGFHGQRFTTGTPSGTLTARFAVLRRPATRATGLSALLRATRPQPGLQLYLNQIQPARKAFGATFYVIPAGNVSGQRGVPERCGAEQVAALKRKLSRVRPPKRGRIIAAQRRYLAYLRYLALHPEGLCGTFVLTRAGHPELGDNWGCATLADFGRWGVLADTQAYLGGSVAAFWTVVPDGVATVTLSFAATAGTPLTHTVRTTARAMHNVVVAKEPYKAPGESGFPSTIVLRGRDGTVIKKITVTPNMLTLCGYGC
jgi:hypothetical protein